QAHQPFNSPSHESVPPGGTRRKRTLPLIRFGVGVLDDTVPGGSARQQQVFCRTRPRACATLLCLSNPPGRDTVAGNPFSLGRSGFRDGAMKSIALRADTHKPSHGTPWELLLEEASRGSGDPRRRTLRGPK